jgi:hypothetical protein
MANIVVTTTTTSIKVDFGTYASQLDMSKGTWNKSFIMNFLLRTDGVLIDIQGQPDWIVSFDGSVGTFQIDSVNAVTPTSNSDLYDKLIALIA